MKVTHHFAAGTPEELSRRRIEIHRRCLLLLQGKGSGAVVPAARAPRDAG